MSIQHVSAQHPKRGDVSFFTRCAAALSNFTASRIGPGPTARVWNDSSSTPKTEMDQVLNSAVMMGKDRLPIALMGQVYVRVCLEGGAIQPGNLLVSSSI